MRDFGIPYSYSPVIATKRSHIENDKDIYKKFLTATRRGYLYAKNNPDEAVEVLAPYIPQQDKIIDLKKCLTLSAPFFGTPQDWGIMEKENVNHFLQWLYDHGLETSRLTSADISTNELLS